MNDHCFVSWLFTERCNFDCAYCSVSNPGKLRTAARAVKRAIKRGTPVVSRRYRLDQEIDEVLERFARTGLQFTFGFTGGEPLIYPKFAEICAKITAIEGYRIALDTNLTVGVDDFMAAVPPEKVEYMFVSTHIVEREQREKGIDDFAAHVRHLKEEGYDLFVNYVLYPPLIGRFRADFEMLKSKGVIVKPMPFVGSYQGKKYPDAYNEDECDLMEQYNPDYRELIPAHYRGKKCNAGYRIIRVAADGAVSRCVGDDASMGNVFEGFELKDGPTPCPVDTCPCFDANRLFADT